MAVYRYIFLTLRDDTVIEEIDLFGVNATRQLSGPGSFTGSFQFDQTGKQNIDLVAATTPGRCWLVMERDGVPVWWGIVWSRTYQSQAKSCQLFAWGFEAYPQKEKVDFDFVRTNMSNTQLFSELWLDLQSTAVRNLNINVPQIYVGPTKNLTVLATDNAYYIDSMSAIANAIDGFDWTIDLTKNNDGSYYKSLRIGYPTMGAVASSPDLWTFEYPGNILNYYQSESMANAGTNVFVYGAGEGSEMPTGTAIQQAMLDQGWPRWDVEVSYKDVFDQAQITQLTSQQMLVRKPPMPAFTITVKGDIDPVLGSYEIGDNCQLVITDPRNPSVSSGPVVVIRDDFNRTVSNGWGNTITGQTWSVTGTASDYSTSGTRGVQSAGSVNVIREAEIPVSTVITTPDIDVTFGRTGISVAPTGNNIEQGIKVRYVDANNFVDVRLFRLTGGGAACGLRQVVGGVETTSSSPTVVGVTSTDAIALRIQAFGSVLRGKAWNASGSEPMVWNIGFITTHILPGTMRATTLLETGNTNTLPVLTDWDDLQILAVSGTSTAGLAVPSMITGYEIKPKSSDSVEEVNILLPGDVING